MTRTRNLLLIPLLLLLATGTPASAQNNPDHNERDFEKGLLHELGQFAINFWVPKLNEYRVRIDRSLPTSYVNELAGLRIRWSMLIEEEMQKSEARKQARAEQPREIERYETFETSEISVASPEPEVDSEYFYEEGIGDGDGVGMVTEDVAPVTPVPAPGTGSASASASASARVGGNVDSKVEVEYEPAREKEPIMVLVESAQGIAAHNRQQMDVIHDVIVKDLNTFIDQGVALVDRLYEKHRAQLDDNDRENWQEMRESLKSPEARAKIIAEFDQLYRMGGESFVMLYNGADILQLLGVALPSAVPLSDMNMPSASMLAQNVPNPAGTSTRIGYTLREPSSGTSLEIFDATGRTMLRLDEGARAAGDHTAMVDVSSFPAGSYLYRLTVQTVQGEQVSSKVLQVVR